MLPLPAVTPSRSWPQSPADGEAPQAPKFFRAASAPVATRQPPRDGMGAYPGHYSRNESVWQELVEAAEADRPAPGAPAAPPTPGLEQAHQAMRDILAAGDLVPQRLAQLYRTPQMRQTVENASGMEVLSLLELFRGPGSTPGASGNNIAQFLQAFPDTPLAPPPPAWAAWPPGIAGRLSPSEG